MQCVHRGRIERRAVNGPLGTTVERRTDAQLYDTGPGSVLDRAHERRFAECVRVGPFAHRVGRELCRRACAGHRRPR
ncbi:hypothetical protein ACWEO4_28035 [Streptomyces sp. NPDC004393]|uniref:hypothetical protein n=1 Tax=Streptomyces sp. NPDC004533 TaxID=3154278 RepID=UPI0033BAC910